MDIREVLIIVKRSALARIVSKRELDFDEAPIESLRINARLHKETLQVVRKALNERGIRSDVVQRAGLPHLRRSADSYDLVITIGGDGTLLRSSHMVTRTPMLGVNSSPSNSVGMLCGATAESFPGVMDRISRGRIKPVMAQRIQATIKGKPFCPPALNDILFAHRIPASTSRYIAAYRGISEAQKSSGVWIATAAGSTAAVLSCGARALPIQSKKLQFVVRELYGFNNPSRIRHGIINPDEYLEIRSTTIDGAVYVDGQATEYHIPFGVSVFFSLSPNPIPLVGYNREQREAQRIMNYEL